MTEKRKHRSVELTDIIELIRTFLREGMSRNLGFDQLKEILEESPYKMTLLFLIAAYLIFPPTGEIKAWLVLSSKFFNQYLPDILFFLTSDESIREARIIVRDSKKLLQQIIHLATDNILYDYTLGRLIQMVYAHFDTGDTFPELTRKMNNMLMY